MESVLKFLYEETTPELPSPAYREKQHLLLPFQNTLEETFPEDFLNALTHAQWELSGVELEETFQRGFRLGFALARELGA